MNYKVHLVSPNLRKNETIIQIADSLDHLSRIVDDIMVHIEIRVGTYNDKLKDVSNRVNDVERKISQLRDVKNAVQVFSSCKYPVNNEKNYISIFPNKSEIPMVRHEVKQTHPLKINENIDKLHVYHVKLSNPEPVQVEGLGQIPHDANCISDLLLYNSGRNPFREFSLSSSLQLPHPPSKTETNKFNIGNAPASIAEKSLFSNKQNQEYFYSPDLGDVPSIDVPLDLPDLPGIAGNVRYEEDTNLVIAPSVALSPALKNSEVEQKRLIDNLEDLPEIQSSSSSSSSLKEDESPTIGNSVELEEVVTEPSEVIDIKPQIDLAEGTKNVEKPVPKSQDIHDARTSLMEAIRKAGGSKVLKSVDAKQASSKNESSGDLMADLHAKLAMRRKGISGARKDNMTTELDSRGALSLISALIPPPEEVNDETDQGEDWE